MKTWKRICIRLLFPPLWLILFLVPVSAAALVAAFMQEDSASPAACVVYVVSFYTLTVLCLACWKTVPDCYRRARGKVYGNRYAARYLTDPVFKTQIGLYGSLAWNLVYVAVNAVSAVLYRTNWFAIFAVYYAILAVMRFLLLRYTSKNSLGEEACRAGELRRSRSCACILLTVNLVLSGVVLMMSYFDRGFHYRGYLIYVMAFHTFYSTSAAVKDVIKYRRYASPVLSVSKLIRLTASLFSMLFLETAMLEQFGEGTTPETKRIFIMATGAGISVIVVGMAMYVIVKTTGELKETTAAKRKTSRRKGA